MLFRNSKQALANNTNSLIFSCIHVVEQQHPILYVTHDKDGDWQFLCGCEHTTQDARIISLKEALDLDKSIKPLSILNCGQTAQRSDRHSEWIIK